MDERNNDFDFDFMPIGQAIKKAREARGMTREQLSGIIGYELMDFIGFSVGLSLSGKQTDFSVSSRPKSQAEKPTVSAFVLLQPDERHRFELEAPCLDYLQCFGQFRKSRPQEQYAILVCQLCDIEIANILNIHSRIVLFRRTLYL